MTLLSQPFIKASLDPTLIPGIYDTCDQWCMYCPATARCLAYQCRPPGAAEEDRQDIYANIANRMLEGLKLLRDLNQAGGRDVRQLDALMKDPSDQLVLPAVDDPLERMGRRHAKRVYTYLLSRPDYPFAIRRRHDGPLALEVLSWFHTLIAAKIYRALTSSAAAARGDASAGEDARAAAKVALIGIDRSRAAIQEMQQDDEDARLDEIGAHLRRLARDVEARYPDARAFARRGLDF